MHFTKMFSQDELDDQIAKGMVKITPHPSGRLSILNYTQVAQFTPEHWNHVTDKCRGLILDPQGNVVARAFEKFWNLDDTLHPETMMANLPAMPPTLTRKLDGSLGVGYALDGFWYIATRGSFTSEQAAWASAWLAHLLRCEWPMGYTPVFEIIYPENQIVVRYDFAGLVLLSLIEIDTGEEAERPALEYFARLNGIPVVEQLHRSVAECAAADEPNEEGYVAAWARPGTTPLRVKIKMNTYCRLHKLLTQTSIVGIWEMLRDGQSAEDIVADVPDEFVRWVRRVEADLQTEFRTIKDAALTAMLEYPGEKMIRNAADKKAFALYAITKVSLAPILFAMVEGKEYRGIIWKMIRPHGATRFMVDTEG